MKEEKIKHLFQTIRKAKPEVEWADIEKFVMLQPATVYTPNGSGSGTTWFNLKNMLIMISSVSVLGIAIQIMVTHNNPNPAKAASVPVVDSSQEQIIYPLDADSAPANDVRFGPISGKQEFVVKSQVQSDDKLIAKDSYEKMKDNVAPANENKQTEEPEPTVMTNMVKLAVGDTFGLSPFSDVILQDNLRVFITNGDTYDITIDGCKSMGREVAYVKDKQLYIAGTPSRCSITVKMPASELSKVYLHGSGVIEVDHHFTNVSLLEVKSNGSINVNNGLNAKEISMRVLGSGAIKAKDVKAETIKVDVLGSGKVENSGNSKKLVVTVTGSGVSDTKELDVENATATVNGSGLIQVKTNKILNATVLGSGDIYYYGNPEELKESTTGSGSIKKK